METTLFLYGFELPYYPLPEQPPGDLSQHDPDLLADVAELRIKRLADRTGSNSRAFGRGGTNNQARNQPAPASRANTASSSTYSQPQVNAPSIPSAPPSPSLTQNTAANEAAMHQAMKAQGRIPQFFREQNSGFIVKGNFMTLAAKPVLIEEGEWVAHQVVEQIRLLTGMLRCVHTEDRSTGLSVCNERDCPAMSAGATVYMWIDTNRNPINLPAPTYIKHIQTWVNGKIQDPNIFPTESFASAPPLPSSSQTAADPTHWLGKTSGFPQRFEVEVRNMYKQMFRCYAHLYWTHWLFFYHTSSIRELNTCFMHFISVGRLYGLLSERDMEPMQPLIDIWLKQGVLPDLEKAQPGQPLSNPAASPAIAMNEKSNQEKVAQEGRA
ncbi:Mob1/phocein [Hortaea werneckii]|uniref:Mob1/phocein n=1 Tax=Hortaea werneckii TaxID=91943 RepID=A0A3M7JCD3_HORWE|nr:Mob1/phocein [Hortaea werneckii]KAI6826711.1 Mob1/phocein [Hortaea werneckii]KAI6928243.1 Mob1/phocein [Hortaea werneckii]KAI6969243.1 Mob1/phocein [Hortaea werneckii]KAI6983545.1 Mob1/phocein [Hortaea werneckii]